MAHVELSVSEPADPVVLGALPFDRSSAMESWCGVVLQAAEPCLVVSEFQTIEAASMTACRLLGLAGPTVARGVSLYAGAIRFVDFAKLPGPLPEGDLDKIPPVLAFRSGRLARGLLRIHAGDGDPARTLDAVATPLMEGGKVVGSLTFLSPI